MKNPDVTPDQYFDGHPQELREVCRSLQTLANAALPQATCRLYHGAPVWFLGDNPLVGVTVLASGVVQLLFWAGQSFEEPLLVAVGKYKAAEARFTRADQVDPAAVGRWLRKAVEIQWDYPNLRAHGGVLKRRTQT